jgi:hypothetical protein
VYDHLSLTSVIVAFLVIVLSIQSKLGLKVNILYDRLMELWNGPSSEDNHPRKKYRSFHVPSQADDYDRNPVPPLVLAPQTTTAQPQQTNSSSSVSPVGSLLGAGPFAANTLLGSGSFSSFF